MDLQFLKRIDLYIVSYDGEERFIDYSRLFIESQKLQKKLCTFDVSCIENIDKLLHYIVLCLVGLFAIRNM